MQNERGGGVGLFIKSDIQYTIRDDLSIFLPHVFEAVFVWGQKLHRWSNL